MAETVKYQVGNDLGCGFMSAIFHFSLRKSSVKPLPANTRNSSINVPKLEEKPITKPISATNSRPSKRIVPQNQIRSSSDATRSSTSSSNSSGLRRQPTSTSAELSLITTTACHRPPSDSTGRLFRASSGNIMLLGQLGNLKQQGTKTLSNNSINKPLDFHYKTEAGNIVRGRSGEKYQFGPEVLKSMGNEKYKQGRFEEALALYNKAISLDPNRASYHSNKSAALIGLGHLIEAAFECREAVRIEPNYLRAHHRLATLYLRLGEAEEALDHYKQSGLKADIKDTAKAQALKTHLNECSKAKEQRDWVSLLKESQSAICSGADSAPQIYAMQVEALLKLHRHQEAHNIFQKVINFDIDSCIRFFSPACSAYLLTIQAQVYIAAGRFELKHNSHNFSPSKVRAMFSLSNMPSTTSIFSTFTSFAASAMLVKTVLKEVQDLTGQFIRPQLQQIILDKLGGLMGNSSSQMTIIIDENIELSKNQMFQESEVYLRTKITPSVVRLKVSKAPREKNFSVTADEGENITDAFEDIKVIWKVCTDYGGGISNENDARKSIELSFHKKHREKVLSSYLPYVLERSKAIKEEDKVVKLYSLGNFSGDCEGEWGSVNLDHPSTFDTLAMDPTLKKELMDDLDRFVKRKKFYKRVGKAWKRGYLLYGPPGTGKSSLIAAIANYLKFHIYDLELTSLQSNSNLRSILTYTANPSILVIEDIDCSSDFQNRQAGGYNNDDSRLALSGLLNFIDGLWSSCGDKRIIIFTTNHKDRLDPALLRPGRMDIHIHMSYCTPSGFKILASNYLGINNHSMFTEIEKLITEVEVTPAEIAEELMKSEDADTALSGLLKHLHTKKMEHGKENVEGENEVRVKEQESEEAKGRS